MAFIGLKHPVFSGIQSTGIDGFPSYNTGLVVGKAMEASVSIEHADSPLYADDELAESEKGFLSGSIKLGVDDLGREAIIAMLGSKEKTVNGSTLVRDAGQYDAPLGGFGYYRVRKKKGVRYIRAFWYYKTQWVQPSEEAKTKGESVEWQTPSIEGEIFKLADGEDTWRDWNDFESEADAIAWLDEMANIGEGADLTDINTAISAANALDSENYTSASWVDLANALEEAAAVVAMSSPSQSRVDSAATLLNAAIASLIAETVAVPIAAPGAGEVNYGDTVILACATDGASIYYTTDGSDPDETDTEYSTAIELTEDVTIKAIAVKSGMTSSAILTAAYTVAV